MSTEMASRRPRRSGPELTEEPAQATGPRPPTRRPLAGHGRPPRSGSGDPCDSPDLIDADPVRVGMELVLARGERRRHGSGGLMVGDMIRGSSSAVRHPDPWPAPPGPVPAPQPPPEPEPSPTPQPIPPPARPELPFSASRRCSASQSLVTSTPPSLITGGAGRPEPALRVPCCIRSPACSRPAPEAANDLARRVLAPSPCAAPAEAPGPRSTPATRGDRSAASARPAGTGPSAGCDSRGALGHLRPERRPDLLHAEERQSSRERIQPSSLDI